MEITIEDIQRILGKAHLRLIDTVTVKQAAQVLEMSPNTLQAQRGFGNLAVTKEEGRLRIEVREVIRYAAESRDKQGRRK